MVGRGPLSELLVLEIEAPHSINSSFLMNPAREGLLSAIFCYNQVYYVSIHENEGVLDGGYHR